MTKIKTRPDTDGDKTIGELIGDVLHLEQVRAYLEGADEYGVRGL